MRGKDSSGSGVSGTEGGTDSFFGIKKDNSVRDTELDNSQSQYNKTEDGGEMMSRFKTIVNDQQFGHLELRNSNDPSTLLMPPKRLKKIGSLKMP